MRLFLIWRHFQTWKNRRPSAFRSPVDSVDSNQSSGRQSLGLIVRTFKGFSPNLNFNVENLYLSSTVCFIWQTISIGQYSSVDIHRTVFIRLFAGRYSPNVFRPNRRNTRISLCTLLRSFDVYLRICTLPDENMNLELLKCSSALARLEKQPTNRTNRVHCTVYRGFWFNYSIMRSCWLVCWLWIAMSASKNTFLFDSILNRIIRLNGHWEQQRTNGRQ